MDLYIAWNDQSTQAIKDLEQLGWCGGALNLAKINASELTKLDNIEELLPSNDRIKMILPQFPTIPYSERFERNTTSLEPFQLFSRITIEFDTLASLNMALKTKKLNLFDIIAICPRTKRGLDELLNSLLSKTDENPQQFDLIQVSLNHYEIYSCIITPKHMTLLRKCGIFVELGYLDLIPMNDSYEMMSVKRQQIMSKYFDICKTVTRGHLHAHGAFTNLIFSSGNESHHTLQFRGPADIIAIAEYLGLSKQNATSSITSSCDALLKRAEMRRRCT